MKWFCLIVICCLFKVGFSQNLIPNHSFEDTISCPDWLGQLDRTKYWFTPLFFKSTELYHACDDTSDINVPNSEVGVPKNFGGSQQALDGDAYVGFIFYYGAPNVREYISVRLNNALQKDTSYMLFFSISLADSSIYSVAKADIGAYFSTDSIHMPEPHHSNPLPFQPQITTGSKIEQLTDTANWVKLSTIYKAIGGEEFITIGNFKYDSKVNSQLTYPNNPISSAYYYIDDVSLTPVRDFYDISLDSLRFIPDPCYRDSVFFLHITNTGSKSIDFTKDSVSFITKVEVGGQVVQTLITKVADNSNNPVPGMPLAPDSSLFIEISPITLSAFGQKHKISTILSFDKDVANNNDFVYKIITPPLTVGDASISKELICPGETVNLEAEGFIGEYSWEYSNDGTQWNFLSHDSSLTVTPQDCTYYRFNICNRLYSDTFLVDVLNTFRGSISVNLDELCAGERVDLTAKDYTFQPTRQYSKDGQNWKDFPAFHTITDRPLDSTFYRVKVCGTVFSDSILVSVPEVLPPEDYLDRVCKDSSYNILPVGYKAEELLWFHQADDTDPFHSGFGYTSSFNESKLFFVQAKKNGCYSEEKALVNIVVENCNTENKILQIPNIFTPNGDGINDIFYFHNAENKQLHTQIFNRWGEEVAGWSGNQGWDGGDLPKGVYYYLVRESKGETVKVHKGKVSILR